jgi:CRISPR/Cas system-associated protein Cas5 (RAMP superfamily)
MKISKVKNTYSAVLHVWYSFFFKQYVFKLKDIKKYKILDTSQKQKKNPKISQNSPKMHQGEFFKVFFSKFEQKIWI